MDLFYSALVFVLLIFAAGGAGVAVAAAYALAADFRKRRHESEVDRITRRVIEAVNR